MLIIVFLFNKCKYLSKIFIQNETKSLYLQRKRYNDVRNVSKENIKHIKGIGDFSYEKINNVAYGGCLAPCGKCR